MKIAELRAGSRAGGGEGKRCEVDEGDSLGVACSRGTSIGRPSFCVFCWYFEYVRVSDTPYVENFS
jgi:hypothetical protein